MKPLAALAAVAALIAAIVIAVSAGQSQSVTTTCSYDYTTCTTTGY
jgi:hypothetical protein